MFKEYTQNHQRKENTFLKQRKTLTETKKALYCNKESSLPKQRNLFTETKNRELKESTEITENNKQGTKVSEQSIFKKTKHIQKAI